MTSVRRTLALPGYGGLALAADWWPRPEGPAALLLHGGGQTRHAWGATGQTLAERGYEVMSLDLRGHGDSAWAQDGAYRLSAFRDDVHAALTQLARPTVVVGASLGGIAALLAAGEGRPEAIAGLVLVDIAPTQARDGAEKIQAFMQSAPEGFGSLAEAADAVAAYLPHRPRPKDPSGLMKNLRERNGRLHWHWDPAFMPVTAKDRFEDDGRLAAAARRISAPTLLVRGAESEIVTAEDVGELRNLIPHVEVVEVAGARHMVAGDQNTAFGRAMLDFILRVAPPAS